MKFAAGHLVHHLRRNEEAEESTWWGSNETICLCKTQRVFSLSTITRRFGPVLRFYWKWRAFSVETAAGGIEALEKSRKNDFDLVLLDCRMPDLGGLEVTRRIRQRDSQSGRVPILGISVDDRRQWEDACLEAGMDGFVPKSEDFDRILEKIHRLLAGPHMK